MKTVLMISGGLRGFHHCFPTWGWLLAQCDQVCYYCPTPQPGETRIEELIPAAIGQYVEDDPWVEANTTGHGVPLDPVLFPRPHNQCCPRQACMKYNAFQQVPADADVVIHTRPDNWFEGIPPKFCTTIEALDYYIVAPRRFSWGGCCDRFLFGGYQTMKRYAELYYHLNDWTGDGSLMSGNMETRLWRHMRGNVIPMDLDFHQVAVDGTPRNNDPRDYGEYGPVCGPVFLRGTA